MKPKKHPWRNTVVTLGFLLPVFGYVVYSSFHVSKFECTVCMDFAGGSVCRTTTGATEAEGLRTAVDNACAMLTSGVTETLRCQRTTPRSASCEEI